MAHDELPALDATVQPPGFTPDPDISAALAALPEPERGRPPDSEPTAGPGQAIASGRPPAPDMTPGPAPDPATPEGFAARTRRRHGLDAGGAPTFEDGTAYHADRIVFFYTVFVAPTAAKDRAPMPDVLFRLGEVSDDTAARLHDCLPGFHGGLKEARISVRALKHIYDSRPELATHVIALLERAVHAPDEVLPNPSRPDRAFLLLRNINPVSKSPHGLTVLEVAPNGCGIDVVTSMTTPENNKNLREALAARDKGMARDQAQKTRRAAGFSEE